MQAVRRLVREHANRENALLLLRGGLLLGFVVAVFVGIRSIGVDRLQALTEQAGIFGPVVYIVLRALASVFAPFSSGPLQLASGILFGFVPAVIYSAIGSTLGYSISYWIARRYGRGVVERLLGGNIERVDGYLSQLDTLRGMLFGRVILSSAYDFIAYAAGLSGVRFPLFVVVTLLAGVIPIAITIGVGLAAAGDVGGLLP